MTSIWGIKRSLGRSWERFSDFKILVFRSARFAWTDIRGARFDVFRWEIYQHLPITHMRRMDGNVRYVYTYILLKSLVYSW